MQGNLFTGLRVYLYAYGDYIFSSNKKEDNTIYLSMFRIRKNYRTISTLHP